MIILSPRLQLSILYRKNVNLIWGISICVLIVSSYFIDIVYWWIKKPMSICRQMERQVCKETRHCILLSLVQIHWACIFLNWPYFLKNKKKKRKRRERTEVMQKCIHNYWVKICCLTYCSQIIYWHIILHLFLSTSDRERKYEHVNLKWWVNESLDKQ